MKLRFEAEPDAYRITLDDPPLHILDIALLDELRAALGRVRNDRHALIIDASGSRAFSAGVAVQDHLGDRAATMLRLFHDCFRILLRLDVVTVAIVDGPALGGGCELAMACDFVLASQAATFGQPEIHLGVFAPVASYQQSRLLPPRKGLELLLTGDPLSAPEAARLGLVNLVYTSPQEAEEWLHRLYRHSASSLRFAKKAFRLAQSADFDERLARVERLYLDDLMKTDDATEGLKAFLEKRTPGWGGR
ncbi:MAG TPA: enoyl-CoA hydratase/isomerase family protein [Thermoanaerobaculia bacterium]|nr:enoyl-CoA hydratase/isomerase family protein [Thermoanaerobaculia bacterium]